MITVCPRGEPPGTYMPALNASTVSYLDMHKLVEHFPERGQVTVVGGGYVAVRVHPHPGDVMPGIVGELLGPTDQ